MSNYNPAVLYNPKSPANRFTFFWGHVYAVILGGIAVFFLGYFIGENDSLGLQEKEQLLSLMNIVVGLLMFVAGAMVVLRRLKDLHVSGWFLLMMLLPVVNIVFALYLLFAPGKVEAGETEDELSPSAVAHS